ncbi:hypothetical protein V1512DRAFT_267427 [Lipomyces arxii]|uniref:uncharacterized protein n=1 Tax=Lipomyces arxii TaxID=56418 RepID=UPI0034CD8FBC
MSTATLPQNLSRSAVSTAPSSVLGDAEEDYNMDQGTVPVPVPESDEDMLAVDEDVDEDDEMQMDDDVQFAQHTLNTIMQQDAMPSPPESMQEDIEDGADEDLNDEAPVEVMDDQLLDAITPMPRSPAMQPAEPEIDLALDENVEVGVGLGDSDVNVTETIDPVEEVVVDSSAPQSTKTSENMAPSAKETAAEETVVEVEEPEDNMLSEAEVVEVTEVVEIVDDKTDSPLVENVIEDVNKVNGDTFKEINEKTEKNAEQDTERQEQVVEPEEIEKIVEVEIAPEPENTQGSGQDPDATRLEMRSIKADFPQICVLLKRDDEFFVLCPSESIESDVPQILDDDFMLSQPLEMFFPLLRGVFSGSVADDSELLLEIPQLKLSVTEDNTYTHEVTVYDLVELYDNLCGAEAEAKVPSVLEIKLKTQPRFISRFNYISELIRNGHGLSYLKIQDEMNSVGEESDNSNEQVTVETGVSDPAVSTESVNDPTVTTESIDDLAVKTVGEPTATIESVAKDVQPIEGYAAAKRDHEDVEDVSVKRYKSTET